MKIKFWLKILSTFLVLIILLTASIIHPVGVNDQARTFTRLYEFDYLGWTLKTLSRKGIETSLELISQLDETNQREAVYQYLSLIHDVASLEAQVDTTSANPQNSVSKSEVELYTQELREYEKCLTKAQFIAEAVLQHQISLVLADENLAFAGQPLPPVLFHSCKPPMQLIISPREVIRQDASISLVPDIELQEIIKMEKEVESNLDVSALVVPLGGISTYPTMVIRTSDLSFLLETIAHEWIHNYLALFPLGIHYSSSPQLHTINETVASIGGKEISQEVIRRFYADLLPPQLPTITNHSVKTGPVNQEEESFDFRQEMYLTRLRVDQLLVQEKVLSAEQYMERRREVFWEHGYYIRRLNQAYFAFHGAYADVPYGAAGKDPVGTAVRILWGESASLGEFINRMRWISSYEELQRIVYSY